MDPSFVGMAAVIALMTVAYLFKSDDREKEREAAAARLGLFFHAATFGSESRLEGKLGELAVVVRFVAGEDAATRITISKVSDRLTLAPRGVSLRGMFSTPATERGDERFERAFDAGPLTQAVVALLNRDARKALMRAIGLGVRVADGDVSGSIQPLASADAIVDAVQKLADVGRALRRSLTILEALAENAMSDPNPNVRLTNLRILVESHATNPQTLRAARATVASGRPSELVVLAASVLPPDEAVPPLARIAAREREPEGTRAAALTALDRIRAEDSLVIPIAQAFFDSTSSALRSAGVDALANRGRFADAAGERMLLGVLAVATDGRLVSSVAAALGAGGSAAAVGPLHAASARIGGDVGRACDAAIGRIQSRLVGAAAGQVSVAEVDSAAGALGLSEEQGRLALPLKDRS